MPEDIAAFECQDVPDDFHAKGSAVGKNYIYRILNKRFPDPFFRNRVWHIKDKLDLEAMQKAAECFKGTHDFAGFASSGLSVKTTVRTIFESKVYKENDIITFDVSGNGFLYNMVRIMEGTLVYVGLGRIQAEDLPEIINSCDRTRGGITAPPHGLFLWGVEY